MKRKKEKDSKIEKLLYTNNKEISVIRSHAFLNDKGNYIYPFDIVMKEPNNAYGCSEISRTALLLK